ncbi:hypothetical protein CITFRE_43720 [Citrobacter freundii]|nr:hypothetical protein CITFRE_43720 [Citrobacter freundii]
MVCINSKIRPSVIAMISFKTPGFFWKKNDNTAMIIKTRISKDEGKVDSTFSLMARTR